jgi:hypothetical protein
MPEQLADHYPNRIVTFIDILGFARDVMKLREKPGLYMSIDAVLCHIAMCKRDIDNVRLTRGVRFDHRITPFSDCLVMSYEPTPGASLRAIADAAFIGQLILRPGYLPRGAITLGSLVHDDAVVFGEGLVRAYGLETRVVDTPRIVITDEVLRLVHNDLAQEQPSDSVDLYVRDLGTGPFVHVLGSKWPFLEEEREKQRTGVYTGDGITEMYEQLRDVLPIRYRNAPHKRAERKIEWMRDYVNSVIDENGLSPSLKVSLPTV